MSKENLDKIVKILEEKAHSIVLEDREGNFLIENQGKKITLILVDKSIVEGELLDIDKNRIILKINAQERFFYKHAVMYYYKS